MSKFKTFVHILGLALMLPALVFAAPEKEGDTKKKTIKKVYTNEYVGVFDANGIEYFFDNGGRGATDPLHDESLGLYFPKGTDKSIIYQDGFVWSGQLENTDGSETLISGGGTYVAGLQAGPIVTPGSWDGVTYTAPVAANATDTKYRVFKIYKDADGNLAGDVADWPFSDGAPYVDANGNDKYDSGEQPRLIGDETLYYVANDFDNGRQGALYGSNPAGIEVQSTTFGFDVFPYQTMVFTTRKLVNKSGLTINDMYVSAWSDPDLGDSADDLVGVDTTRKLGYVYNATNFDQTYNEGTVPAAGYVFFQGPLVDALGDSGISGGVYYQDKRNLPLSSFAFYINGGPANLNDPPLGSYTGTITLNRYQQGLDYDGNPLTTATGVPTKFPYSGNPVTGQGDVDGTIYSPADRRLLLSSGPFSMPPWVDTDGDGEADNDEPGVQEIVVATIVGQGSNNLSSVKVLQSLASKAQFAFDINFDVPSPPPAPVVKATALDGAIVLDWSDPVTAERTESDVQAAYEFEAYTVYQLPTSSTNDRNEATIVATFDVVNGITFVNGEVFDEQSGDNIIKKVLDFKDSGIQRSIVIETDRINSEPLKNNREYYFAVTATSVFNPNPNAAADQGVTSFLENSLNSQAITIIPQEPNAGFRYEGVAGQLIDVTKVSGASDGVVQAKVVDPSSTTGQSYNVVFAEDTDPASPTFGEILWNVQRLDGSFAFAKYRSQYGSVAEGLAEPTFDGVQVVVTGPPAGFKDFLAVQNAAGVLDPPSYGAFAFNASGFPSFGPHNLAGAAEIYPGAADRPASGMQSTNASRWGIHTNPSSTTASYDYFLSRVLRGNNPAELGSYDYEIRFTADSSVAWMAFSSGAVAKVPFELWNIGINTPGDASDDYRMIPWVFDEDGNDLYNLLDTDHSISGGTNDPYTDWIYWRQPVDKTPGQSGYQEWVDSLDVGSTYYGNEVMARMTLVNFNGGAVPGPYNATMVEPGTVFRLVSNKPNAVTDVFSFTSPAVTYSDAVAKKDINKINVFPNPYLGANPLEINRFARFVTFTHLPADGSETTIRIFTISGTYVTTVVHDGSSQYNTWDLQNADNVPVASGMYVAYVETKFGTKVLKIAVIQEAQYLENIL